MKKIITILFAFTALAFIVSSCVKDLDTKPIDPDETTAADVFDDPASYKQILAKLYAGLAVSGQQGPSGQPDISGIDEGFGQYLRGYYYHQELPTDEAVIGWNDQTIKNFHGLNWGASDVFIAAFYYRVFYQISACNEYLRETTDSKLDERGVQGQLREEILHFRAEARFLRALSYWHAIDIFANPPFVTENDPVGAFFPRQIKRAELFDYIETELLEIENILMDPKTNEYARADKAAAWMLLAKLYLNAEVYTGSGRYADVITYTEKVISAGYDLADDLKDNFVADNHNSPEIIFPVAFDGLSTQTWGGMTFIIHAGIGGEMDPAEFGMDGGWGGTRVTSALVRKFYPDITEEGFFSITPPNSVRNDYPVLYVPGNHQGWDPATAPNLASVNSDENYEGYIWFPEGNTFKITDSPNWDNGIWGATDPPSNILESPGADIATADEGYYKINVNTTTLEYSVVKTEWGMVGEFTGWGGDPDVPMEYDQETDSWTATVELPVGPMKFRANSDWGINLGESGSGTLVQDGADISIEEAGTYVVTIMLGTPDYTYSIVRTSFDKRAMFWSQGQTLEIEDIGNFNHGWASTKFTNVTSNGVVGKNLTFPDTDFPMFRLADAYLMYAEAVVKGGGGSSATAVEYINRLRQRAYGDSGGDITIGDMSTGTFILDERARELYWECHRRTDLIRYGVFTTGTYLWPWKGNTAPGTAVNDRFNIFPIPFADVNANPNLTQNPGY
jgi:hypothetical protein